MKENISPDWVKMIHMDYLKHATYCTTAFASKGMSPKELLDILARGPLVEDNCIIEGIPTVELPDFVEGAEDREELNKLLVATGLTGSGRFYDQALDVDPYEHLGFQRIMVTARNHYVYRKDGASYMSLGYTFSSKGITVNPLFISFLVSLDDDPDIELIWFITSTAKGLNPSFDILYDVRFQDYIVKIARDFQARFVDFDDTLPPVEYLLPAELLPPSAELPEPTDPADVICHAYHGDTRAEAAMSRGDSVEQIQIAGSADEVDYYFRRWLVEKKTNFRPVYRRLEWLFKYAGDKAPEILRSILSGLKAELLEREYYEHLARFTKGVNKIKQRFQSQQNS